MRTTSGMSLLVVGFVALFAGRAASAATLGVLNDFEAGAQGWVSGPRNPNPPVVAADGGPQGMGDAFLRATADGASSGGRLIFFNSTADWRGSYTSAGIAAIEMDLKNLTEAALHIRVEIEGPRFNNRIVSTFAAQLAPFQDWTHVRIPIDAAGFAGSNVAAALANALEIRILHNPQATPSTAAPFVVAQLGIDNIRAVPEPSTALLMAAGLAALAACPHFRGQTQRRHARRGCFARPRSGRAASRRRAE